MVQQYLDSEGNLVEKKDLIDTLREKNLELGERFDKIKNHFTALKTYLSYLSNLPLEHEANRKPENRLEWEDHHRKVSAQLGLEGLIDSLEEHTTDGRDILGDQIVVLYATRPLCDSYFAENKIGECHAWTGRVKEYELTNLEDSKFLSEDGLIHKKIVLEKARELTDKEFKDIFVNWQHLMWRMVDKESFWEGVDSLIGQEGDERVQIYAPYQELKHFTVVHERSEDEKFIEDKPYVSDFNVQPFYGPNQIEGSERTVIRDYGTPEDYSQACVVGSDGRSIGEIYNQLKPIISEIFKAFRQEHPDLEIHLSISKKVDFPLTGEEVAKAKASPDRYKWLNYWLSERGLNFTDEVLISPWVVLGHNSVPQLEERLIRGLHENLPEQFRVERKHVSAGTYGGDYPHSQRIDLHYVKTDSTQIYAGEQIRDISLSR
jgi:hypothetical protein